MKRALKKKSKRIPTRTRAKAEKKVREHNRKIRKDKKQNPGKYQKKARKNLNVPNDCPFKETILQEVEEVRQRQESEKANRRARIIEASKAKAGERLNVNNVGDLMKAAEEKSKAFEADHESGNMDVDVNNTKNGHERSAKTYYKEFAKVVDEADVVLQVLDARDPLGTRCAEVENLVLGQGGKRLVLVLTKADLIPKDNLDAWLKYFRAELPTVAFKASTQQQAKHLGHARGKMNKLTEEQMQTSKSVGVSTLMTLLGNYCRNKDVKSSIRVGVVGYPNVGKSSLINSLKRSKVCSTGNKPGVTKVMQAIQLDGKIKLLDCPGMVLSQGDKDDVQTALKNAVNLDLLADFLGPIEAILQRTEKQYIQLQYEIPDFDSAHEFLSLVGRSKGKLKRGGIPDQEATARLVLNDWNSGKIKYFTHPPEKPTYDLDVKVVSEYAKEFSLDDLQEKMDEDRENLPEVLASETTMLKAPEKPVVSVRKPVSKKTKSKVVEVADKLGDSAPPMLKKAQKLREKKEKKDRKRRNKLSDELSAIMNSAL